MAFVLLGIILDLLRCFGRNRIRNHAQGFAGLQRQQVGLASPFKVKHPVKGLRHSIAQHHDPVIAHHHDLLPGVIEQLGAAFPFFLERQPTVIIINDHPVKEHATVLIHGRQTAVCQRRQRRGIGRMHVHRATGMGAMPMHATMQPPGRGIRRIGPFHAGRVIGIDHDQVRRLDARKMHLVGVHQEFGPVLVDGKGEMVRHCLVHVQAHGPAKGGGKVHAFLPVVHVWADLSDCHDANFLCN
mmetsp:Transcript_24078/g.44489  ORF Transcript_24078/g.44489 Transcript_24078/m.44489 type:complete len:242 (+) Transcript_24078:154-879(+)